jgi:uncharacterized protein YigE (DUF2233 family)
MKKWLGMLLLTAVGTVLMAWQYARIKVLSYEVNPAVQDVQLFWKNDSGTVINSFARLAGWQRQKGRLLVYAMNGGMYTETYGPVGLYVEAGKLRKPLNTAHGDGNFYLKPNGVFGLTKGRKAFVCTAEQYPAMKDVWYATQSGPMLVIDGAIHPAFKPGSENLNIRNGVGILPGNKILFAMSQEPVNLYDFAMYFRQKGCLNALYLDGFVSRTYWPAGGVQQRDGWFGVMIGVTEPSKQ